MHDSLPDSGGSVYDNDIFFGQFQTRYHIPHQFLLGTEQPIRELIHDHIIINNFLVSYGAILIEKSPLIQMRLIFQRSVILRVYPTVCKIILSD